MDKDDKKNNAEELKREDKKILFLSVLMIIFLLFVTFLRSKKEESVVISLPEKLFAEDLPNISDLTSKEGLDNALKNLLGDKEEENGELKEVVVDEKIKISIPSSWNNMDIQKERKISKNIETFFIAHSLESSPVGVVLLKINSDSIEKSLVEIEKSLEENYFDLEVLEEDWIDDFILIRTVKYFGKNNKNSLSLEKIILTDDYCYFVSVIGEEFSWESNINLLEKIISTVQIIN